jgi:hypothetical protein
MQQLIAAQLLAATSEAGFSLDELVLSLREVMAQQGLPALARLILELIDETLALTHATGRATPPRSCACGHTHYELKDRRDRQLRTSLGTVHLRWRRLECRGCGKDFIPLRAFLGLERWQSKTAELERIIVEVMSEQSYRRGSAHLDTIGEIPVPKSTAHRWIAQTSADQWDLPDPQPLALVADGTGFKRRPEPKSGLSNHGEVRVVVGLTHERKWVGYGVWSGESWAQIAAHLRGSGPEPSVHAQMFVSDGEKGLADNLAALANNTQRCRWHVLEELKYILWQDGAKVKEQRQPIKDLAAVLAIDLPEGAFEPVQPQEKQTVREQIAAAQKPLEELIARLRARHYDKAAGYLEAARGRLFRWLEFWLQTGLVSPATTSWLERLMRELGRRLKKIAFGWSESGAAKMARILLRRCTDAEQWTEYWKQRLQLQGRVQIHFRGVKTLEA